VTPYDKAGQVNHGAVPKYLDWLIESGCAGFFVGGSTGEGFLQNLAERISFAETVIGANAGRAPLVLHVGALNPLEAGQLAKFAGTAGYDAISSVAPFYYRYTVDEIADYYRMLADESGLPMIVYYIPATTGVVINNTVFAEKVLSIPGVVGVKYTDSDLFKLQTLAAAAQKDLIICGGWDEMALAFLNFGADCLIGSTYNFVPRHFAAIYEAFQAGDNRKAMALQKAFNIAFNSYFARCPRVSYPALLYAALKLRGTDAGSTRQIRRPLDRHALAAARELLARIDRPLGKKTKS
jgi:N-acetylneuraminate lyase